MSSWERKVFIPADDGFIRYLDIMTNLEDHDMVSTFEIRSLLGSGDQTVIVATGNGDLAFTEDDHYVVTDDADGRRRARSIGRLPAPSP